MIKKLRLEDARSDVKAEWDAWEAEQQAAKAEFDRQMGNYRRADRYMEKMFEDMVRKEIGTVPIDIYIKVDPYSSMSFGSGMCEITIKNYPGLRGDVPFGWDWHVTVLADGTVSKESGSWSGLQVTTPEEVGYLADCVSTLEALTRVDWKRVIEGISKMVPKSSDYVTVDDPTHGSAADKRYEFQRRFKEAGIQDIIGKRAAIKASSLLFSDRYAKNPRRSVESYFAIVKATPEWYDIIEIPCSWVDDADTDDKWEVITSKGNQYRLKKDTFFQAMGNEPEFIEF